MSRRHLKGAFVLTGVATLITVITLSSLPVAIGNDSTALPGRELPYDGHGSLSVLGDYVAVKVRPVPAEEIVFEELDEKMRMQAARLERPSDIRFLLAEIASRSFLLPLAPDQSSLIRKKGVWTLGPQPAKRRGRALLSGEIIPLQPIVDESGTRYSFLDIDGTLRISIDPDTGATILYGQDAQTGAQFEASFIMLTADQEAQALALFTNQCTANCVNGTCTVEDCSPPRVPLCYCDLGGWPVCQCFDFGPE